MAVTVTMPGEIFGNIDFGITVFAEENGYDNGFCTTYTEGTECSEHGPACNGYQPATDSDGDGVYEIGNAGQLYWFAALVNGTDGLTQNLGANAILTDNITINENVLVNGELNSASASSFRKWTPIGYTSDANCAYTGTFDGKGNTISGLYYSEDTSEKTYAGLFGYNQGTISNMTIEDSRFYLSSTVKFSRFGAIVGHNEGTIQNCNNTGTINGTATDKYSVGGICGVNKNQITNCYNSGIVNITDEVADTAVPSIGGICGENYGRTTYCNNAGKVCVISKGEANVGGVCGININGGTVDHSHNTADVNVSGNTKSPVGGVCGQNRAWNQNITSKISNCSNAGNITGLSYVGGVCGYNYCMSSTSEAIIINSFNTGTVSGTGYYVGGVCGCNDSFGPYAKITNCYFDSDVYSGGSVGVNDDGTVTNTEGKTTAQFANGEVCYLLNNGETDGTQVWYQTIKSDSYPLLDNSHGTVYASEPCPSKFSNTDNLAEEHNYTANAEYTVHTCTKCGETHNAEFTTDDTADTISICHGFGSVTLKAPTENLTYDGTAKAATVDGKLTGIETPKILYKLKDSTEEAADTAPTNAGTYVASITYTDAGSVDHTVSVEYTIEKAELTVEAGTYKVSKGYDGTKNAGTGSGDFEVNGLVAGDSVTINADSIGSYSSENVGTEYSVEVTISLTDDSGNYKLKNTTVSVPAEIYSRVITADDLEFVDTTITKTYDGTTSSTATAQIKASVFGTAIPISGTAEYDSKDVNSASKVTFTPDLINIVNYTLAPTETIEHSATITAKDITVTADDNSKTYGESDPTFTYTVDTATPLAEGDTLTGALDRAAGEDIGTYDITQGTLTNENNPNYNITFNKGTFKINGTEINEIVITGITAPVKMVTLDTDADTTTTGCTPGAVSWTDGDTSVTEAGFDKAYTATVTVTADSNHTFGSSLTATVNGETASVTNNGNGTATVTFTFEKTAAAAVTGISINTLPTKTEYFVGEDIDLTGAKISATYEDGNSKTVDITSEMISGFDSSTAGTNTVTVTYEGKTTTFNVTIKEPAVTGIRISTTPKTEYLIDDTLDVSGGEITVSYENGADKVISITSAMVTGFDSSAAVSSQTLTVTYEEKTATYVITVKKHTPTVTAPTASAITLGQTLADSALSDTTWSWSDSTIEPTSAGTKSYTAVKNVDDANYYDYSALSGFTFNSSTNTLTTEVSVEVKRAAASVTPPTASNTLTYGQTLADAGLTEGWAWENASTVPDVNNTGYTAYKIVTDYDNYDYSNLTGFDYDETNHKLSCKVAVTVNKATPNVTAPTATAIRYGEALSASTLTTGWTWADNTIKPDINNSGYAAYKIVTDYANYDYGNLTGYTYDATNHKLSCTVAVTVNKGIPTVTAPTASAITFGQTLAESALSDTTWSWSDSSTKPTSAGTHSYTAVKTVSDADKYDYTALSGFTFNSSTNTLSTNVSVVVNRVGASVTPPTASNTLTYGQTLADAGLTAGWTWENASTVPDVNNAGFTAYKIVTDYDNFDYSNLTGFVYDETAHKISCTVAVTVNKATPTDATTASQSFTKGTASTAFAAPVFKGVDSAVLTGSVSYTYGGQTYTTTAALTAALDLLDGGESGTISYTFTPTSANYTTASGSISFSVIDAVVTGITLKSAPTKTTYEIGDTLDLTGGKITVSYNNGTSIDIDITAEMISGFDSTTAGEKTVTVTYSGFTATFKVTVSKGSFTVEPTPGNVEGATIDMPKEELYDAVLTPEDQELIEQGVDIAVLMTVITINPETVPANDVTAIENVMDDFDLGCYIDVSLLKRYSNGKPDVPVTDTNSPITISFKVPANILAQYPVSDYEYSIFCSHNGVGYPITCTYNAATNVMSFSSTMFSTYALAVKSRTPAAVDYTITADSHVTVQATAQAGDIVSVTVEDGYKATVTNSLGTVITTITGTGSFVMPESNVTITSELINTHVHNYSTEWNMDSTSHWHECACGDKVNIAAHVSNGGIVTVRPTETTEGVRTYSCSICGYVMSTETIPMLTPDHSHSYGTQWKSDSTSHWHECDCGEKVDIAYHISDNGVVTLQPTETSEGIMTYSCSICDYILRTETIPANTPVHTHNYGTAWYYDSTCHWHECSCGDKSSIGQHISDGGRVTVQPTAYTTGVRTYSCSVCGYVLRTETIPATGYNYPSYPTYPTYPTYPFDSSIFNVVTFTDKVNVTAETEGNTITIKWDKVEKADKYYVYQYKNGKYVKVKTTSDTSATFKKLKNGETYKFLVRYTKSGRLSPTKYSGIISVKVYYKPIPKPTATKNSIKLTWEAVPEAEKYAIYKYVDGKAVKLTETKKLSVKIGKLIPDTEYKYIVRAYVDGKWTTMLKSDIVTVKTTAE